MTQLNFALLFALLASSMYLVQLQYESRKLFTQVVTLENGLRKLETERERLDMVKRSLGTPMRFEKIAKEQLGMSVATPSLTVNMTAVSNSNNADKEQP